MNRLDDREVNVFLLLKYILEHWKYLVIAMVLGALIGAGIGYLKAEPQKSATASDLSEEEIDTMYHSLTEDEQDRVDYIVYLNNRLSEIKNTLENDPIMNVNPYDMKIHYRNYDIQVDEAAYKTEFEKIFLINRIRNIYTTYVRNGQMLNQLLELYPDKNITLDFLRNMIDLTYSADVWGDTSLLLGVKEVDSCPGLEENVRRLLKDFSKEVKKNTADHNMVLIDEADKVIRSENIIDVQDKVRLRYDNTRNAIRLMKTNGELSDAAIKCYECKIGENGYHLTSTSSEEMDSAPAYKSIIKYALIVLIGGFGIACIIIGLYYILFVFHRYIVSKEDYSFFNLKCLGDMDDDLDTATIISKICKYCSNNDIKKLAVLSTDLSMVSDHSLSALKSELQKKGIEVVIIDKDDRDDVNIEQLLQMNYCLFIEKINATKVADLNKLVGLCKDYGIKMAGVVNIG